MAPFADNGNTILEQQESWITADDGLQRSLIGQVEGIFCSCDVAPMLDTRLVACRQTDKWVVMLKAYS